MKEKMKENKIENKIEKEKSESGKVYYVRVNLCIRIPRGKSNN